MTREELSSALLVLERYVNDNELRGEHAVADVLAKVQRIVADVLPEEWGGPRWPRTVGDIGRVAQS
jgi:hypothetical protein